MRLLEDPATRRVMEAILAEPGELKVAHLVSDLGISLREARRIVAALGRADLLDRRYRVVRRADGSPARAPWFGPADMMDDVLYLLVEKGPHTRAQLADALDVPPDHRTLKRALSELSETAIYTPRDLWPSAKALAWHREQLCPA